MIQRHGGVVGLTKTMIINRKEMSPPRTIIGNMAV